MSNAPTYVVRIKRSAEREMDHLPRQAFERVRQALIGLEEDPRPRGSKKLRGVEDYRLRVGSYRVLYSINDRTRMVEVIAVGHRKDVYRGL
ncbi:MAG: hypothetical protein FLDDKLPJ_00309 [Phycisphaerae bacterium]|nr:hypothetical protein [Phycisphaerae bacterium]